MCIPSIVNQALRVSSRIFKVVLHRYTGYAGDLSVPPEYTGYYLQMDQELQPGLDERTPDLCDHQFSFSIESRMKYPGIYPINASLKSFLSQY